MSEPASFFLRVAIEKSQFKAFLTAAPSQPVPNQNWTDWWNSREMYGDAELADEIRAWQAPSNGAIVDGWLAEKETGAFSRYDEARQVWDFAIMMCSENYGEIVPLIAFCQSLQPYRNATAPDDFAIIYPFFWGDDNVMAYMTYGKDGFVLAPDVSSTEQVPQDHMDYADARLQEAWTALEADMEPD